MNINNFDQSSTGTNIEFTGFLDADIGYIYFKDSIKTADNIFYKTSLYAYHVDFEDIRVNKRDLYDALCKFSRKDVKARHFLHHYNYLFSGEKSVSISEACEFIYNESDNNFKWYDYTDILHYLLPEGYDYHITRGYSQGDAAIVIMRESDNDYTSYIDNLFWDAPFYAALTVNENDFYFDEHMDNTYKWNKDEALGIVKKHFNQSVLNWCVDNLPEYLQ